MSRQYWAGTEDSLRDLLELEREVAEYRKAAAGSPDRQAFFFMFDEEETSDDNRLGSHLIEKVGETGVIKVAGSLTNAHQGWHKFMAGRVTSYEALSGALDILVEDESVSKIMLKVSSGGGAVTGLDTVAQKIRRTDSKKPVVAHTGTMAFSAAYWLASSAREVYASRMAEVGSIGTLMVHQSFARAAEKEGIDFTVFRAGKYKAVGLPYEELTDEDKAYLQADIDKANSFFLGHVSMRRNLMISNKGLWAEGKTFFAEDAQSVGLVDRIADIEDLLTSASGAAYHKRSMEMQISAEKLAQIEAGANPEDVLSAEELKQYQAALETEITPEAGEPEQGGEEGTPEPNAEGNKPETNAGIGFEDRLAELLKANGKLEAQLEARDEKIADLEGKMANREATFNSLLAIGVDALNKRQVALGKAKTEPSTAEGLINAYNDISAELQAKFRVGQQSQELDTSADASQVPAGIPLHLKARKK